MESFFSLSVAVAAVVTRENIAILSRTLRLHTSSVLPPDAAGLLAVAGAFLAQFASVSESVLPTGDDDTAAAAIGLHDGRLTVGPPSH